MKEKLYPIILLLIAGFFMGCGGTKGSGKLYKSTAEVSYYADEFNGRKTASGETFSNSKHTAAHRSLAFGSKIVVTNLANHKSVTVKINDRGPWKRGRELDLSKRAFMEITDNKNHGTLRVSLRILK